MSMKNTRATFPNRGYAGLFVETKIKEYLPRKALSKAKRTSFIETHTHVHRRKYNASAALRNYVDIAVEKAQLSMFRMWGGQVFGDHNWSRRYGLVNA